MAEAFVNSIATERGLPIRAASAGTVGGKDLNPAAAEAMKEIGIPLVGHRPKLLTQHMADDAEKIISMGCGVEADACPAKFLLTEDWALQDPHGQGLEAVRTIRDEIRKRVETLIEQMIHEN
jgi:arsenate reductase (thioredoxin)